jgi:hypothetical protein
LRNGNGALKIGAIAGVVSAVVSMMLPSPTTIATFKPWAATDRSVRYTFWGSIIIVTGVLLWAFIVANGDD